MHYLLRFLQPMHALYQAFDRTRSLRLVHPGYRDETQRDEELLQAYRADITSFIQANSNTEQWRIHALRGSTNCYHITPEYGSTTYIIRLQDGLLLIERFLTFDETCPRCM